MQFKDNEVFVRDAKSSKAEDARAYLPREQFSVVFLLKENPGVKTVPKNNFF